MRYYKDYAGGTDLGVYGAHDNLYFGRIEDGVLESEFSGNLTEVCPTGVFTDKTHSERYNRKWDMQFSPSICHGCAAGCNISPGERYGEIRRIENRYNGSVNHYFLCDRGRFGYGYVNRKDRPRQPMMMLSKMTMGIDSALDQAAALLKNHKVIGIGSPRASLESNFALRELVGADNFYSGISRPELELLQLTRTILQNGPLPVPTIRDMEDHDAVLVLGEDLTQTSARIALALRQAVKGKAVDIAQSLKIQDWNAAAVQNAAQNSLNPLFICSVNATRLDDVAEECAHAAPADLARLGFAVAHAIDSSAPAVKGLDAAAAGLAKRIAAALLQAERPLLVAGSSLGCRELLEAAANIASALKNQAKNASLSLVLPEANSMGVAMLLAEDAGDKSVDAALQALLDGSANSVIVLENDLYRRADKDTVDAALSKAKTVVVADHQSTATTARAHLVLPVASFAEGDGTLVSQEGRAQRFFQVFDPAYYDPNILIREGWRWLHALQCTLEGKQVDWTLLDHVTAACARAQPELAGILDAAPAASFRIKGLKLAREPLRYSGRTSMRANLSVHEPRTPQDPDTAFAFSMEGYSGSVEDRQQIPFAWSPGWNSPQAWNKFQDEVGGHLRAGDPGARLIEAKGEALPWFVVPAAYSPSASRWQVVPLHHLFGSDETSAAAVPIQTRIPDAYVALGCTAAERLGLQEGTRLSLTIDQTTLNLPVRIDSELADGLIGLPAGLAVIPAVLSGRFAEGLQEAVQ